MVPYLGLKRSRSQLAMLQSIQRYAWCQYVSWYKGKWSVHYWQFYPFYDKNCLFSCCVQLPFSLLFIPFHLPFPLLERNSSCFAQTLRMVKNAYGCRSTYAVAYKVANGPTLLFFDHKGWSQQERLSARQILTEISSWWLQFTYLLLEILWVPSLNLPSNIQGNRLPTIDITCCCISNYLGKMIFNKPSRREQEKEKVGRSIGRKIYRMKELRFMLSFDPWSFQWDFCEYVAVHLLQQWWLWSMSPILRLREWQVEDAEGWYAWL